MLSYVVEHSLRLRFIVVILACVVVGYGLYVTQHAKLDVFPDFVPPQIVVQTEAPGLSPEQVETLVTAPVEGVVLGTGNLESVRSQSIQGLSVVTAQFTQNTDVFLARQMLGERLSQMSGQLPVGVHSPKMAPLTSATMDLYKIGLTADAPATQPQAGNAPRRLTPMELRTLADWFVRPRLLGIPGVANVTVYGGEVRQIQIQIMPARMAVLDVSINDVLTAARSATGVRGAGYVETKTQRIVMQTQGDSINAEQLGEVVLARRNGNSIRMKDVARVVDGAEPKFGDATIDGRDGVFMALLSQYGANTRDVTDEVEKALKQMEPTLNAQGITLHSGLFRPASFIDTAIGNMRHSLLLGGVLVAVVLFLFLWNLRSAFISLTAIPLSLLIAIIILDYFGVSLNTITLGGLAIAIGEVVDDAIIDVENIHRRLRENALSPAPRSAFRVVLDASLEVRSAVVYATFVVILVFLPVLTMSGLQGRLFAPLGKAYILAVLASLGVALTVTPALAMLLLPQRARRTHTEPRLIAGIKAAYRGLLRPLARHPLVVVAVAVVLCGASLYPALRGKPEPAKEAKTEEADEEEGGKFLPEFREGHFVVQINAAPGTSLEGSRKLGKILADTLLKNELIASVPQQIGRAELGEDTWGPNRSEFHINLKPGLSAEKQDDAKKAIEKALEDIPGIGTEVTTFLGDRIGESIAGEVSDVVVSIFGNDLDVLDRKANDVLAVLKNVRGVAAPQLKSPPGAPHMFVKLRPERLKQFGLQPVEVLDAIQTAYGGEVVGQVYDQGRVFNIAVILDETHRRDPESVGSLLLRNAEGVRIAVGELADVYGTTGRSMLLHDNARRRQVVTCNVKGRDIGAFVEEARRKVTEDVKLPPGTYVVFSGAAEARAAARRELLLHGGIATIGIILLLSVVLGRISNLLLVLVNLPFALVGGVLAIYLTGSSLESISMGAMVGFVTLFGITTRNSIMMISHYEHLVRAEGSTWGLDTALRGASERFIPIIMTALVTGLGLLPIAWGAGEAGREIEGPMAFVILGGLATSTLLNLLVLPTLALRFGRFEPVEPSEDAVGVRKPA